MRSLLAALLFVLLLAPTSAAWAAETRIALVIGNSAYSEIVALKNPTNDARLIRNALQDSLGFEVIYVENADKSAMDKAIVRFGKRLAESGTETVALFYYAGHGVQSGNENFLLPVDISIAREADLPLTAVRANDVLRQMDAARSNVKIVILDACRDNPFANRFKISSSIGLADISLGNSEFTLAYAATAGRRAQDGDGANSPYAAALARHLPTPDQELFETFRLVRQDVATETRGQQLPEARTTMLRQLYLKGAPAQRQQIASATPMLKTQSAVALPANFDISGKWCEATRTAGPAFAMSIAPKALEFRVGDTNEKYVVRSIQPTDDGTLLLHWLNKQKPIVFEFGEFSSDGKSMTQLRGREELTTDWKQYERRFRRC